VTSSNLLIVWLATYPNLLAAGFWFSDSTIK